MKSLTTNITNTLGVSQKKPINLEALTARMRRKLDKVNKKIIKSPNGHWLVDLENDSIVSINIEDLARKLKVLRGYEELI
jgi:cell division septal protein FtsQ